LLLRARTTEFLCVYAPARRRQEAGDETNVSALLRVDVHKATLSACVRVRRHGKLTEEIRTFGTTSDELLALRDWLSGQRVTHVAMEATGVYWKPVYYVLEQAFTVLLVNPADVKRMPGRKTDVSDCAWLAQLLEYGLLEPSFVPPPAIRELRDLVRYRTELKHDHTRIANRLHKILQDPQGTILRTTERAGFAEVVPCALKTGRDPSTSVGMTQGLGYHEHSTMTL